MLACPRRYLGRAQRAAAFPAPFFVSPAHLGDVISYDVTAQRPTGSRPGAGRLRRVWRSSGFAGDSSILNTTAVSVRARWKKGQWAAVGKLLSQLSFSVYAGQVVFRGALRQDGDRELGDRETFLTSLFSPVLFCFLFLLGSFCLRTRAECAAERSRQQLPAFPFFVFRFPRLRARSARPGALALT